MTRTFSFIKTRLARTLLGCFLPSVLSLQALAQGTAFTYQGVLNQNGAPYTGSAEFQFTLWNDATAGNAVATNNPANLIVAVSNGLFTVTLDFGTSFPGADRWLRTDVRTVIGPYTTLGPRQKLTPTPYAVTAGNVVSGGIASGTYSNAVTFNNAANSFTGTFEGTGAGLTNLNAGLLNGLNSDAFWKVGGNLNPASSFLGPLDNRPLIFSVNGRHALRLEPATATPNIIGGNGANYVSNGVEAATIAGGGNTFFLLNRVGASGGTVGGGLANHSDGPIATIAGGFFNDALGAFATVAGGDNNLASATNATVGGGSFNVARGDYATVPGGRNNAATNDAFAAGRRALANHAGSFVWADSTDADFSSTGTNQFRIRAGGGVEIVGSSNQPAWHVSGTRSGGFASAVGLAENLNTTGASAPALRVLNVAGNSIDGALSVSAGGTGFIAKFGNSSAFVADLTTNGTFSAVTFNPTSDRNAKENLSHVDAGAVLEKVAALPIHRWNFKGQHGHEHVGPMAQDFHAAFGLNGDDDKHIATVDADGVALAAIQGLNQKLEQKEARISALENELAELKRTMNRLLGNE